LREEDPATSWFALTAPIAVIVHRSRFEVDLNRPRESSVYLRPEDAWGLDLWDGELDATALEASRKEHDDFYAVMGSILDEVATTRPFVVLDMHSYNHRRGGPGTDPETPALNPEVNIGTRTLDRERWSGPVDSFIADLERCEVSGHHVDVRENVRFGGGHLAAWVNERYDGAGCALALEFKKTFMDEWTGEIDTAHLDELVRAVASTLSGLRRAIGKHG